jgi:hypothetical protein
MSANTIEPSETSAFDRYTRTRTDESKSASNKQNINDEAISEPFQNTLIKRKEAFAQIKELFSGIGKRKIMPCCKK